MTDQKLVAWPNLISVPDHSDDSRIVGFRLLKGDPRIEDYYGLNWLKSISIEAHPPQPLSAVLEVSLEVLDEYALTADDRFKFHWSNFRRLAARPVVVNRGLPSLHSAVFPNATSQCRDLQIPSALQAALIAEKALPAPDSPASIRASLEGIEPAGAGDGPLAMAWIRRAYNGTGPFTIWNMEVAYIAGYNAALATAPAALVDDAIAAAVLTEYVRICISEHDDEAPKSARVDAMKRAITAWNTRALKPGSKS